ncbi:WD-40 repeat-containing protein [Fistulina hepatica ATCC 64428]|nr:WD-40 repeat-containing protein [Fistulina hepatica ATCC 64428]
MGTPAPASPRHLLRSHLHPITALFISADNERIYSADASGLALVTSTRSLRPLAKWAAHTDSILGVEEWEHSIITHGRDNKLHVWTGVEDTSSEVRVGGSAATPGMATPTLRYSLDVNALNYCRFSLLVPASSLYANDEVQKSTSTPAGKALIAVTNLVDSSCADVWSLPDKERMHAAIGRDPASDPIPLDGRGNSKTGIIMSLHLFYADRSHQVASIPELRLLVGYEHGGVTLRRYATPEKARSVEGKGWETLWHVNLHAESVMAMRVSKDNRLALTVSADNIVGRYDLLADSTPGTAMRTKHPGSNCVAIRDDGRVCAIGNWDGRLRLYSTKTMRSLGTLKYHQMSCSCLEFAHQPVLVDHDREDSDSEDDDLPDSERKDRDRWLVAGSKDNRISIWSLVSFNK